MFRCPGSPGFPDHLITTFAGPALPTHSQPRALRHTLLTNIMSLWIRAPRN